MVVCMDVDSYVAHNLQGDQEINPSGNQKSSKWGLQQRIVTHVAAWSLCRLHVDMLKTTLVEVSAHDLHCVATEPALDTLELRSNTADNA